MASSSSFFFVLFLLLVSALFLETTALPELPNLTTLSFEEGYTQLFGDSNLMLHRDGMAVHLSLDQRTGASPPLLSVSASFLLSTNGMPVLNRV